MTSTTAQATLTAPDISCGHCVATVTGTLTDLAGVERADASAETKEIRVRFDPSTVSLDDIHVALADAGYPARP